MSSPEAIDEFESLCRLEDYLKEGGHIKKDCWLNAMHLRYNPNNTRFELVDHVSTSTGERILGVRESYERIWDVPYAGNWIKCTEEGKPIDGDN